MPQAYHLASFGSPGLRLVVLARTDVCGLEGLMAPAHSSRFTTGILLAATTCWLCAVPATAQTDESGSRLQTQLRAGDRVALRLDSGTVTGRLESVTSAGMVVSENGAERRIRFDEVQEARRKRMGFVLGTAIGAGVGAGCGIPLAMLAENETGEGGKALLLMTAMGAGVGFTIDALLNREHTVYRRTAAARLSFNPAFGAHGGGLKVALAW
jgi:hypothetical protein